jgi:hypothetical protein
MYSIFRVPRRVAPSLQSPDNEVHKSLDCLFHTKHGLHLRTRLLQANCQESSIELLPTRSIYHSLFLQCVLQHKSVHARDCGNCCDFDSVCYRGSYCLRDKKRLQGLDHDGGPNGNFVLRGNHCVYFATIFTVKDFGDSNLLLLR